MAISTFMEAGRPAAAPGMGTVRHASSPRALSSALMVNRWVLQHRLGVTVELSETERAAKKSREAASVLGTVAMGTAAL